MNNIKCNASLCFKHFPVGTVFESDEGIFIKISPNDILDEIAFEEYEGGCTIDIDTLPNAVNLTDGTVAYFRSDEKINTIYPSATISIE